jgi:acetyl-CoA acetyltransferase
MERRAQLGENVRHGLVTLCVGVGQGEAAVIERVA